MSSTTVAEFASELKKSTETLLEQLKGAGVAKSAASDTLSDADKHSLLNYLQASHGTATADRKKITLVKKSTSEIKQADSTGKARTIQVEVRKKRTFIRRDDGPEASPEVVLHPEVPTVQAPVIDNAELARREEEARRQAELIRRQEEELAQRRLEREQQEARAREVAEKAAKAAAETAALEQSRAAASAATADSGAKDEAEAAASAAARAQVLEKEKAAAQAQTEARDKAAAESKARAAEEVERAADLGDC